MKKIPVNLDMEAFRADMLSVLDKHTGHLDGVVMLSILAHTLGQLMAMQDATKYTAESLTEIVIQNIQSGNAQAVQNADKWMPRA